MEKSVCVHPWTFKMYQFERTVLVSVRIFVNKINTYQLKRWNVRTTCKAFNCFSTIARIKYSIVTSHLHLHLLLLSWWILKRHHINQLLCKERRLYEDLKLYYERLWSRNGQWMFHYSANNRERWSRKAIAWRFVSCKMTCYHVSDEKTV